MLPDPKEQFVQAANQQLRATLAQIAPAELPDIYALSCWYFSDNDDLRFPTLVLGYNTTRQYQAQLARASSAAEAKWNYAFWLQNELATIGGEQDELLAAWFRATPSYYSPAEEAAAADHPAQLEKLYQQGELFNEQFMGVAIQLIQRLFAKGVISDTFGHNIPVLLHELEYYDQPAAWTQQANPPGLADEFLQACAAGLL